MKLPTIGTIGSHSAEEIGVAAKSQGLKTVVICQKGRERLYTVYDKHLFDHFILVDSFKDITNEDVQNQLQELNTLWMPNRSFTAYLGYDSIERDFNVPIYGNRKLLRIEERGKERDQYWLLERSSIATPRRYRPDTIDRLVLVKVPQKTRPLERAFFYAESPTDYEQQSKAMIGDGVISSEDLTKATIEEFIIAPRFNANFQAYAMADHYGQLDFAGFDDRVQTGLTGLLNLPAREQLKVNARVMNEEAGHFGLTMRESKKPLVYEAAERFVAAVREHFPPKMIGLFSLQGALTEDSRFVVFDVSPRVPGAPCIGPTSPEMRRLSLKFKHDIQSPLDLCMIDIKQAVSENRLNEACT